MKKTKIIATLGPASRAPEKLAQLFDAGCNVVRVNMSHGDRDDIAGIIEDVRAIDPHVGVLVDTKGPEVRTTEVDAPVELTAGQQVWMRGDPKGRTTAETIFVDYLALPRILDEGTQVLLADGQIGLRVERIEHDRLLCVVEHGGTLKSKKGVNIPGVRLPMPFVSDADAADIARAAELGADFVAASFVGDGEDVLKVKRIIEEAGGQAAVIAKVESRYAVKNLGEIIAVADGVMVARGDLGVEIPAEEVPVVQKQIIDACRAAGRVVIVATEMLESMISNPRPTRAETSDVANAIFEGTDAVMLSGETSVGEHPIEAVATMSRIARIAEAEVARRQMRVPGGARANEISELICKSAWLAARELRVTGILVPTSSGRTARRMSRYRPRAPILATCPDEGAVRRLALSYGVIARQSTHAGRMETMVRRSCQLMHDAGLLQRDDLVAVVAGVPVGYTGTTNLLTVQHVWALLGERK